MIIVIFDSSVWINFLPDLSIREKKRYIWRGGWCIINILIIIYIYERLQYMEYSEEL